MTLYISWKEFRLDQLLDLTPFITNKLDLDMDKTAMGINMAGTTTYKHETSNLRHQ